MVSGIVFTPAPANLRAQGLLGWVAARVGDFDLDGLSVRRTRQGLHAVGFPERRGRSIVRPVTNETRRAIESAVLDELRRTGVIQ